MVRRSYNEKKMADMSFSHDWNLHHRHTVSIMQHRPHNGEASTDSYSQFGNVVDEPDAIQ